MPLYMDVHRKVDGLTAQAVEGAHARDLAVQGAHGVNYRQYWYDEGSGRVYCLVEARARKPPRRCTGRRTGSSRTSSWK